MVIDYYWYARHFGWTPDQVDNLPVVVADRLITVADTHAEVVEQRRKQTPPGFGP